MSGAVGTLSARGWEERLAKVRAETIEECARAAECRGHELAAHGSYRRTFDIAAAAVRALASQPTGSASGTVVKAVPRGHCNRCDHCGWPFGNEPGQCRMDDCSMRPLPTPRDTCAGCGAPFVAAHPETPAEPGTGTSVDPLSVACDDCLVQPGRECLDWRRNIVSPHGARLKAASRNSTGRTGP